MARPADQRSEDGAGLSEPLREARAVESFQRSLPYSGGGAGADLLASRSPVSSSLLGE